MAYLLMNSEGMWGSNKSYQPQLEMLGRKEIESLQNKKLVAAFEKAKNVPFLRKKIQESGLKDFEGLEDLEKVPFTTKKDLVDCFPYGASAVPISEIVRVHTSTGTTAKPIASLYTRADLATWSELMARTLACAGVHKGDIFQVAASQGIHAGSSGYFAGAELLGVNVIPYGKTDPLKQLETMSEYHVTVFGSLPSFAVSMLDVLSEAGEELKRSLKLRLAVMGAEPWTRELRSKIEERFGIPVYNNYGLAEVGGPGVATECPARQGLHVWEDHFVIEIINPGTGERLGEGEEGELVITPLSREAMPILRYRTGDLTRILPGSCDCGRQHTMIDWTVGRIGDIIKVGGVGFYPSSVEKVIASQKESSGNYQIILSGIDEITIRLEVATEFWQNRGVVNDLGEQIGEEIKDATRLAAEVEIVPQGSLSRAEGKVKRVLDLRKPA